MKTPTAHKLPSGSWNVRLKIDGTQISITKPTKKEAEAEAMRKKAAHKLCRAEAASDNPRLAVALDEYIESRTNVVSPSTLRSYRSIAEHHFQQEMDTPIRSVNWQKAINREAKSVGSPKTMRNVWGLVQSALRVYEYTPRVTVNTSREIETQFLIDKQIPILLEAVRDTPYEIGVMLGLCSLRRSELLALDWSDIRPDGIHVHSALVDSGDGMVKKATKTKQSTRVVPYMIPRLRELLESADRSKPIIDYHPGTLYKAVNRACARCGLPPIGTHGLRRSFASLCYKLGISERTTMILGGWSDYMTVHRHYIKLSEADKLDGTEKIADFFEKCNAKCNGDSQSIEPQAL